MISTDIIFPLMLYGEIYEDKTWIMIVCKASNLYSLDNASYVDVCTHKIVV